MCLVNQICRLCLSGNGAAMDLFSDTNEITLLPCLIMALANVKVAEGDGLPSNICKVCYQQLENFHQFKSEIEKSDTVLRQRLNLNNVCSENLSQTARVVEHGVLHTKHEICKQCGKMIVQESTDENSYCQCVVSNSGNKVNSEEENNFKRSVLERRNCVSEKICNNNSEELSKQESSTDLDSEDEFSDPVGDSFANTSESAEKDKPFHCTMCGKSFKTKVTLRRHKVVHNPRTYHKCMLCEKVFAYYHNLKKHLRAHSGVKVSCTVCNKKFTQPEHLKNHMTYTHSNKEPMSCDICGKIYKNILTLTCHKKEHTENPPGRAVCSICGKVLSNKSLFKHMKTHAVSDHVKCDLCGKSYKTRYTMMQHRKTHVGFKPSCCDICGKTFGSNSILKNHCLTHSKEKNYICNICNSKFTQNSALRTHQRVHSGIEPYICKCGEKFKWKQTFDKHVSKCSQHDESKL